MHHANSSWKEHPMRTQMHPTEVLVVIDRVVGSLMMLQQGTLNSTAVDRLQCIDTVTRMLLGMQVKGGVHMDRAGYTSYAALSVDNLQNLIRRVPEQYTNRVIRWLHNALSALDQGISYEDIPQLGDSDDNDSDDSFELFDFELSLYRYSEGIVKGIIEPKYSQQEARHAVHGMSRGIRGWVNDMVNNPTHRLSGFEQRSLSSFTRHLIAYFTRMYVVFRVLQAGHRSLERTLER